MADYLPSTDGEFLAWEQNFINYANAHLAELGLVAGDMTALLAEQGAWEDAYADAQAKAAAAQAATQLKNDARKTFEPAVRALVKKLQASGAVSNEERQLMGITVPDAEPTPVGPPATRPVLQVGTANPQEHRIGFADEGTPTKKAKPAGVAGLEIFAKKGGEPPQTDAEFIQIAFDTATPYLAVYDLADAGLTVYYRARWVSTRGEKGPWSAVVSAKVPG